VKNARLAAEQRNFFTHVIEILVTAIESTHLVPEGHCWRVAKLATAMGRKLGLENQELQDLYYAATLHDLGVLKLGQSDEEDQIRSHPAMGASMVETISMLQNTKSTIQRHHEYFDGSGYPDGLSGEEIPLGARIIAVVEAYEKAISESNQNTAKAFIKKNSGKLFDPKVVGAFLELVITDED
jgi:putative nucleotidyltransferase with HDIG domain